MNFVLYEIGSFSFVKYLYVVNFEKALMLKDAQYWIRR